MAHPQTENGLRKPHDTDPKASDDAPMGTVGGDHREYPVDEEPQEKSPRKDGEK